MSMVNSSIKSASINGSSKYASSRKSSVRMTPSKNFANSIPLFLDYESGREAGLMTLNRIEKNQHNKNL